MGKLATLKEIESIINKDSSIESRVNEIINQYERDNMGLDIFFERNVYESKYEDGYLINIIVYRDLGFRVIKVNDLFYRLYKDGSIREYVRDTRHPHPLMNLNRKYIGTLDGRVMEGPDNIYKDLKIHKYAVRTMIKKHEATIKIISNKLVEHNISYNSAGVRFTVFTSDTDNIRVDIEFIGIGDVDTIYLNIKSMEEVKCPEVESWNWADKFS